MAFPSRVTIVVPAFNEDGIGAFLAELVAGTAAHIIVVDDASTDGTGEVLAAAARRWPERVEVLSNERNVGHGPTVLRGYNAALGRGSGIVVQVDGDGQFATADLGRLLAAVDDGADVVVGVRQARVDPWYRHVLTRGVRLWVWMLFGVSLIDVNCPFRAYRSSTLAELLRDVPEGSLVPNIYLAVAAVRAGNTVSEVRFRHQPRRGAGGQGTMWGTGSARILIPRRLIRFCRLCLAESWLLAKTWGRR